MPEAAHAATRLVFVYGTLRRGGAFDMTRLLPAPRFMGMAEVNGALYALGWYPGLLLDGPERAPVIGEVYGITPQLEETLDRIEEIRPGDPASEYFKREIEVSLQGRPVRCLVYEIHPEKVRGCPRIAHGDWLLFHSGR